MEKCRKIFSLCSSENKNRIFILDFIRGILIILVLYHHAYAPLSDFVLQFHMPALFILSGYTEFILNKKTTFLKYIKSRFLRLIVPYIIFEFINLIMHFGIVLILGEELFSFGNAIVSILLCKNNPYGGLLGRLWFLPTLFFCSLFSYLIKAISGKKNYIVALFAILMILLSYISSTVIPFRLPFTIDTAFLATAFFLIGHLFGKFINQYLNTNKYFYDALGFVIFSAIFVVSNIYATPGCYMSANKYQDFIFMIFAALSGTALVFIFAKLLMPVFKKVNFINNLILWYSVNSLAVFPVHLTIKILSIRVLNFINLNNWAILFLCMLIFTIPIVNIITEYFPIMIGNFKKPSKSK